MAHTEREVKIGLAAEVLTILSNCADALVLAYEAGGMDEGAAREKAATELRAEAERLLCR